MKKERELHVSIKVFITKTRKFRASIKEKRSFPYEVTIGEKSWKEGKGREYEDIIFRKCGLLLEIIKKEFKIITGENKLIP